MVHVKPSPQLPCSSAVPFDAGRPRLLNTEAVIKPTPAASSPTGREETAANLGSPVPPAPGRGATQRRLRSARLCFCGVFHMDFSFYLNKLSLGDPKEKKKI